MCEEQIIRRKEPLVPKKAATYAINYSTNTKIIIKKYATYGVINFLKDQTMVTIMEFAKNLPVSYFFFFIMYMKLI